MHVNQLVREAVRAELTALSELESVSTNQASDLLDVDMPAAIIATGTDAVEPWSKGSNGARREKRTLSLTVVVVSRGESNTLDDDMDELRVLIEPAVLVALDPIAEQVDHTGGELEMGTDEEGARWFAFLALSWEVVVITEVGDPETAL
jgi:hypothetical protein